MHFKHHLFYAIALVSIIAASLLSQTTLSQDSDAIEELAIWGRSLQLRGTAD